MPIMENRLESELPILRLCPICGDKKPDVAQWCKSIYGDIVCKSCNAKYIARAPGWKEDKRLLARMEQGRDAVCFYCGEGEPTKRLHTKAEICEPCFYSGMRPHQVFEFPSIKYFADAYQRIFFNPAAKGKKVVGEFIYGVAKVSGNVFAIVNGEHKFARQRLEMWYLVENHIERARKLCESHCKRIRIESHSHEAWDYALKYLMKAAITFTGETSSNNPEFLAYLNSSIRNGCYDFARTLKKLDQVRDDFSFLDDTFRVSNFVDGEVGNKDWIICALAELQARVSLEDWAIFSAWAIDRKTLEEIGEIHGVVKSTIHARIAKVKAMGRNILAKWQNEI